MNDNPFTPEAATARPGERICLLPTNPVYATVGKGVKREYGCVFRQFLWLTDAEGQPYVITDPKGMGREEWLCVEDAPEKNGDGHAA
jgi:hypothetical protein